MSSGRSGRQSVFKLRCKSISGNEIDMYALRSKPGDVKWPPENAVTVQVCCCFPTYKKEELNERDVDCGCCCTCCHQLDCCCSPQTVYEGYFAKRCPNSPRLKYLDVLFPHRCRRLQCLDVLSFPNHTTGNQFFTTALYDMYNSAGKAAYKAMEDHQKVEPQDKGSGAAAAAGGGVVLNV
jgi:hypothetical protein